MLDREEIVRSLTGAWWLFLDRPDAMRFFDVSLDGFWRSFRAVILLIPAYALTALAERTMILADPIAAIGLSDGAFIVVKAVTLSVDWVTLPIVLAVLAGPLGIGRSYTSFVVARNWCAVIAVAPFGVISLIFVLGLISADAANFLSLAALIVVLRYNFLIARRALNVGVGFALGIVVLDLVVSLAIAVSVGAIFGA